MTPHPAFEVSVVTQSVLVGVPVIVRLLGMVHPWVECNTERFGAWSFTPSKISISPSLGQAFGAVVQMAGQVPQPCGICLMLKIATWVVYAALDRILTDCLPTPLGSRTVVKSVRRMKVSVDVNVKFKILDVG